MNEDRKLTKRERDENLEMLLKVLTYPVLAMVAFLILNQWINGSIW